MTDFLQDQAALYALGVLDPEEARALELNMASDPALATLVRELQDTLAATTRALPSEAPPPALRNQVLDQIRLRKNQTSASPKPLRSTGSRAMSRLGWGLAAAFAISGVWLYSERIRLEDNLAIIAANEADARQAADLAKKLSAATSLEVIKAQAEANSLRTNLSTAQTQLAQLTTEVETLQQRNALAQVQIATLQSSVEEYSKGVAVVIWDEQSHQGILKLEKMPPVAVDKDYQLWVVEPGNPKPVNAGVVKINADGFAKVDFKPVIDVASAAKFALSVERKGGVPENEGPIVFIGP